ncbi:SH3BP5L [Bugula neritina]|uniref:SH3BP5L n=1 Tax=Bugula neritina TaxID=10212 RepID=A0A7J7J9L1_BUGNE|nr:SH3BP5L [Bugula neritina]
MGVTLTDSNANCIVNHNHHNDYSKTNDDSWTHDVNQSNNNSLDFESCRDHQTKTDSNHSEDEEPLDPRIQNELETMNKATDLINKYENDLVVARNRFKSLYKDSRDKLSAASKKLGTCIHRAVTYYDCRLKAKAAQEVVDDTTAKYDTAVSIETTARETQEVAEKIYDVEKSKHNLSWQEFLNHATIKLIEAEEATRSCKAVQIQAQRILVEAQRTVQREYKLNKRAISKSKPYYEKKAKFHTLLEQQREVITLAEKNVSAAKSLYSRSMSNLEAISNEIHQKRQNSLESDDTHSVDKDLSVRENGDVDSDAVSLESTTPTFTLGHSSSTELLAESDGAASSSIEFFETSNVSLVEEDDEADFSPGLKKRSSSFIDQPVSKCEVPIITKVRSMSFPSSVADAARDVTNDYGSSSELSRTDSTVLDDQSIQGALSPLYFNSDSNSAGDTVSPQVVEICSRPPKHEDYETLPKSLSKYQKHFTLKRSSGRDGS